MLVWNESSGRLISRSNFIHFFFTYNGLRKLDLAIVKGPEKDRFRKRRRRALPRCSTNYSGGSSLSLSLSVASISRPTSSVSSTGALSAAEEITTRVDSAPISERPDTIADESEQHTCPVPVFDSPSKLNRIDVTGLEKLPCLLDPLVALQRGCRWRGSDVGQLEVVVGQVVGVRLLVVIDHYR